ncbi:helix-turn-helix domain-containing protein [Spiractinospora alimapuensis]|uniref:helix-turn-helix domain-containing protein n=1 Tax=Spiractinospora alimapuensis TaxID=2820884 RepID=UPI0022AA82EF|nr:helix-turn-helix transcriptional regulator [Spiractinospora alimapuensis]
MAAPPNATLRARWLGKILRELREENSLTLKEASDHIRRSTATLSRYESGILPSPSNEVVELMNLYGVGEASQRALILRLAEEIAKTGWWERYHKDVYSSTFDWVWLESQAERLRVFNPSVLPGLLQTSDYAERLIRIDDPTVPEQQIERWVSVRMARQEVLARDSLSATFVIDEAALRRPVGGAFAMRRQLSHMIEVGRRDQIDLRVLPFVAGEYPGPKGTFMLVKMPDPFPEVVAIDSAAGNIFLEADDVREFANAYERLHQACLDAEESRAFMMHIEKELS